MSNPVKLSVNLEQIPFELEDAVNGSSQYVLLVALDGKRRGDFMAFYAENLKTDKDGKPTDTKNMPKVQCHLLSLCMCTAAMEDGEPIERSGQWVPDKPVSKAVINSWPTVIIDHLFLEACKLNKLDESDDEAKND